MSIAFAKKPKKISLSVFGYYPTYSTADARIWESGNIEHCRGFIVDYVPFYIMGTQVFKIGFGQETYDYDVNTETGKGNAHSTLEVILGASTRSNESDDGTIEGTLLMHGEFEILEDHSLVPVTCTRHGVLHGTGAYQGWKVVVYVEWVEGAEIVNEVVLYK